MRKTLARRITKDRKNNRVIELGQAKRIWSVFGLTQGPSQAWQTELRLIATGSRPLSQGSVFNLACSGSKTEIEFGGISFEVREHR
jgi:hypothetical protein